MEKLLFIYNNPLDGSFGGSQRTIQNMEGLKTQFDVITYELSLKPNKIRTFLYSLFGFICNSSFLDVKKIKTIIINNNIKYAFFDQATHGKIVRAVVNLKKYHMREVFVHFHNNEEQYYHDLFRTQGILYYSIYRAARKNQLLSLKYATCNIFITKEDSMTVGECNCRKIIIPITLKNNFVSEAVRPVLNKKYALFLGAATYANIEGARYIVKEIAPKCENIDFVIAGKGMKEALKNENIPNNVNVFSFVEDLNPLFENAFVFLVPLFSGSGMKVKIAEAMMYGKRIIGSPLAWWGYEMPKDSAECENLQEYIDKLNIFKDSGTVYSQNSIDVFRKNYDQELNRTYFSLLLGGNK